MQSTCEQQYSVNAYLYVTAATHWTDSNSRLWLYKAEPKIPLKDYDA